MTLELYLWCLASAVVGLSFQVSLKIKSISDKARLANVEFSIGKYFKDDVWALISSFVAVIGFMLFMDEVMGFSPYVVKYVKFGFFFVGYVGSDIMLRIMSVANKRINNAIDFKTTELDKANNTLDKPTPAILPKDTAK